MMHSTISISVRSRITIVPSAESSLRGPGTRSSSKAFASPSPWSLLSWHPSFCSQGSTQSWSRIQCFQRRCRCPSSWTRMGTLIASCRPKLITFRSCRRQTLKVFRPCSPRGAQSSKFKTWKRCTSVLTRRSAGQYRPRACKSSLMITTTLKMTQMPFSMWRQCGLSREIIQLGTRSQVRRSALAFKSRNCSLLWMCSQVRTRVPVRVFLQMKVQ